MPVPSAISDLSQTPASNYPSGSETPTTADDYLRTYASFIAMLRDGKNFTDPVTLASAATTDIGGQNAMFVEITGTTTITSFGTNYEGPRFLRFTGALTLMHNATTLNLPGAANITTAAGDTCTVVPNSSVNGWNIVQYQVKSAVPWNGSSSIGTTAINTLTTVTLDPAADYFAIADASDSGNSKKALLTAATDTASGIVELATTSELQTGTDTTRAVTVSGIRNGLLVQATSQATTSGTTKDFSIPSWAKRIVVMFNGVSTNGTSLLLIRLGSSGIATTGYVAAAQVGTTGSGSITSGFPVTANFSAADLYTGQAILNLFDSSSNMWVYSSHMITAGGGGPHVGSGSKALAGVLDTIRVTTVSADTFDAGSVNIMYE